MNLHQKLRVGVIGTGAFAEACHVRGLQSHPDAEVVAVCGRSYQNARMMADRLGVPDVHTDADELCAREDLDAVTIATPNVVHASQALVALRHGKHVFCEKPLAMTVAEAREMYDAAERSGKIHQVAFTFRYLFGVRELRRRLRAGDVGQPYYLRIHYDGWTGLEPDWQVGWREQLDQAGGGMLYDLGSHLFDISRFVLGAIEAVTGFSHNIPRTRRDRRTNAIVDVETDDVAAAWFRHQCGARGEWFASRATPPYVENGRLEVVGPEGALRAALSRGGVESLKVSRPTRPEWESLPLPPEAQDGKPHALELMMRSFVEACRRDHLGNDDASFKDGLAVQQALAGVLHASDTLTWVRLEADPDPGSPPRP